jgi:hypothetical protein
VVKLSLTETDLVITLDNKVDSTLPIPVVYEARATAMSVPVSVLAATLGNHLFNKLVNKVVSEAGMDPDEVRARQTPEPDWWKLVNKGEAK